MPLVQVSISDKLFSVRQSVRNTGRNVIFSAAIENIQLKFSVKITMSFAHIVYKWFCLSVGYAMKDINLIFKGFVLFFKVMYIFTLSILLSYYIK